MRCETLIIFHIINVLSFFLSVSFYFLSVYLPPPPSSRCSFCICAPSANRIFAEIRFVGAVRPTLSLARSLQIRHQIVQIHFMFYSFIASRILFLLFSIWSDRSHFLTFSLFLSTDKSVNYIIGSIEFYSFPRF